MYSRFARRADSSLIFRDCVAITLRGDLRFSGAATYAGSGSTVSRCDLPAVVDVVVALSALCFRAKAQREERLFSLPLPPPVNIAKFIL